MFHFYNKNDGLRITDLYQGIVWGTQTFETLMHDDLINRFDYDGDYGTVLNRFLVQAIIRHPLTVYGSGERMRAFIHIDNTVECVQLAIENPPKKGDRVLVLNQTAEQCNLNDLAKRVASFTEGTIRYYVNPRVEKDRSKLKVKNSLLIEMGLTPKFLNEEDLQEVLALVEHHKDRVDLKKIICTSKWRKDIKIDRKGKKRKDVN